MHRFASNETQFAPKATIDSVTLYNDSLIVHKLSHQHLYTRFWIVEVSEIQMNTVAFSEIENYAVPVLVENFISNFSVFKN